jgi:hypothetical protein
MKFFLQITNTNNLKIYYGKKNGYGSLVRRFTSQKVHYSEGSLVRRFTSPKVH